MRSICDVISFLITIIDINITSYTLGSQFGANLAFQKRGFYNLASLCRKGCSDSTNQ
jgi:hypothetical protein